ncbi:hypothetical protein [Pannonibacter phragmitetus]|uniref:hypothetical protein n=1 Tax=Pannonibacter phragmitetus TaxID=121719 RepID=UPI0013C49399|nr:hypothetical protein [Pannonibacter phragmitetus]
MSSYGRVERRLAKILDNFPAIRQKAKVLYQYINYRVHARGSFSYEVADGWSMKTPSDIIDGQLDPSVSDEFVGYFNISPWNYSGDLFFAHQKISKSDILNIVIYDLSQRKVSKVAETATWNWQQGSLTRWFDDRSLIYNCEFDGKVGAKVVSVDGSPLRSFDYPFQDLNLRAGLGVGVNPNRLNQIGSDYGYGVAGKNLASLEDLNNDGVYIIDLHNNDINLAVSIAEVIECAGRSVMSNTGRHELNHVLFQPNGERFVFMHRWFGEGGRRSSLYLYEIASRSFKRIIDTEMVSHYSWLDEDRLIIWCRGGDGVEFYHICDVDTGKLRRVGGEDASSMGDGHPVSMKEGLVISDTYPDRVRRQHLFCFSIDVDSNSTTIGTFFSPLKFSGQMRIDLHPRVSRYGDISIDSGWSGKRRTYVITPDARD